MFFFFFYILFAFWKDKDGLVHYPGHLPTVDRDRAILAELLFCFMYLADEINEPLSWFWHSLFRPVCELKLPYCPWLAILREK